MELHQEQLEEQKPFHEAWDLELAKKAEDTYAIIDGWFVSKFCPCRPGECPCNPPLAIMDGPP
jgi:hypothetical protein